MKKYEFKAFPLSNVGLNYLWAEIISLWSSEVPEQTRYLRDTTTTEILKFYQG